MKRIDSLVALGTLAAALLACAGHTLGENEPGSDTYLEPDTPPARAGEVTYRTGSIAVDDRSETAFVMRSSTDAREAGQPVYGKVLLAVLASSDDVRSLGNYTDATDTRMLFPEAGVLLMTEHDERDRLTLFDPVSFEVQTTVTKDASYHGTRMSPTRRWIAVADNNISPAPIHVLDGRTLESTIIPHQGDWLEAMWMNTRDELLAIIFEAGDSGDQPLARIVSWDMATLEGCGLTEGSCWDESRLNIEVPGVQGDFFGSFTWIGVSPDDSQAVFPVLEDNGDGYRHTLLVVDLESGAVGKVPEAQGPVGFTPDGETIVSYYGGGEAGQELLLIDALTLEKDSETVPIDGGLSFFVSHEGNIVVAAANDGGERLVLYDIDQRTQTQMSGPGVGLHEFVSRLGHDELWLLDDEALWRLDFETIELEPVTTDFGPIHINILRDRDLLVLDDAEGRALHYFDPRTRSVERSVTLPNR